MPCFSSSSWHTIQRTFIVLVQGPSLCPFHLKKNIASFFCSSYIYIFIHSTCSSWEAKCSVTFMSTLVALKLYSQAGVFFSSSRQWDNEGKCIFEILPHVSTVVTNNRLWNYFWVVLLTCKPIDIVVWRPYNTQCPFLTSIENIKIQMVRDKPLLWDLEIDIKLFNSNNGFQIKVRGELTFLKWNFVLLYVFFVCFVLSF